MATVTTIDLDAVQRKIDQTGLGAVSHNPGVRASLDGSGCGLDNCNCSDGLWISISNGKTLLRVNLTAEEAEDLKKGYLDTL
jgi:hypothetical protein